MNDKERSEEVQRLISGLDDEDIKGLIARAIEFDERKIVCELAAECVHQKIKNYLKQRYWSEYNDESSKTKVVLELIKRENLDVAKIRAMLNEVQLAHVTRITTYEKLNIITPDARQRLKKYVRGKF